MVYKYRLHWLAAHSACLEKVGGEMISLYQLNYLVLHLSMDDGSVLLSMRAVGVIYWLPPEVQAILITSRLGTELIR